MPARRAAAAAGTDRGVAFVTLLSAISHFAQRGELLSGRYLSMAARPMGGSNSSRPIIETWECEMADTASLRPEELTVETFRPVPAEFHFVDEDPTDPASGTDTIIITTSGRVIHA